LPALGGSNNPWRATAVGLGSVAARGVYEVLDEVGRGPQRAEAAVELLT
jgi:hypothetical protein